MEKKHEVYLKRLIHLVVEDWETGNQQNRTGAWRLREELRSEATGSLIAGFLLVQKRSSLNPGRPLHEAHPTPTVEGNL